MTTHHSGRAVECHLEKKRLVCDNLLGVAVVASEELSASLRCCPKKIPAADAHVLTAPI